MSAQKLVIAIATVLISVWAAAQGTLPTAPPAAPNSAVGAIRIQAPLEGQKIRESFVTLKYQLLNPGATAEGLPTYNVRLDDNSPIETTSTSHTFTGLAPGIHIAIVELIDANGTPIAGSRKEVKFEVLPQQPGPTGPGAVQQSGTNQIERASYQQGKQATPSSAGPQSTNDDDRLPSSGTALPLLSVIGFGVLVGGIVSAMKTRH